jgi:hypothetical protein
VGVVFLGRVLDAIGRIFHTNIWSHWAGENKKKIFLRGSLKFYVHVGTYKSLHYGAKSKLINTSFFSSANLAIDRNIFYCCWKVVVPTVLNVYFMTFSCMCLAFNPMKKPSVHSNWSIFGQKLLGGVPR